jgi:hypothetical protein
MLLSKTNRAMYILEGLLLGRWFYSHSDLEGVMNILFLPVCRIIYQFFSSFLAVCERAVRYIVSCHSKSIIMLGLYYIVRMHVGHSHS